MTAQIREKLIFNGEPMTMAFCPPLPHGYPRLRRVEHEEMEALRKAERERVGDRSAELDIITGSTACWRRYRGTWEVKDRQFFLVDVAGYFKLVGDEPLLADWFTGVLRVPQGGQLTYVHMGFGSVYEEELHIHVERGRVTGTRIYDNRGDEHDERKLSWDNLPGGENRFPGDRDFN
jgi:hypothetical protein